jgi:phosphatidylserine synthase
MKTSSPIIVKIMIAVAVAFISYIALMVAHDFHRGGLANFREGMYGTGWVTIMFLLVSHLTWMTLPRRSIHVKILFVIYGIALFWAYFQLPVFNLFGALWTIVSIELQIILWKYLQECTDE